MSATHVQPTSPALPGVARFGTGCLLATLACAIGAMAGAVSTSVIKPDHTPWVEWPWGQSTWAHYLIFGAVVLVGVTVGPPSRVRFIVTAGLVAVGAVLADLMWGPGQNLNGAQRALLLLMFSYGLVFIVSAFNSARTPTV